MAETADSIAWFEFLAHATRQAREFVRRPFGNPLDVCDGGRE
jgi:hypothetical protein